MQAREQGDILEDLKEKKQSIQIQSKSIFKTEGWYFADQKKAERNLCQQTWVSRNIRESSLGRSLNPTKAGDSKKTAILENWQF